MPLSSHKSHKSFASKRKRDFPPKNQLPRSTTTTSTSSASYCTGSNQKFREDERHGKRDDDKQGVKPTLTKITTGAR